jgi:pSer/pThr/pTyr-binding forkhead associated (FHA) protein
MSSTSWQATEPTTSAPWLYHVLADGTPLKNWPVSQEPLVIGRGEFANAGVNDTALSRSHFMIVRESSQFFVVDLDSQNGTWIKGERITGRKLNPGDIISAGKSLFYFSPEELAPGDRAYVLQLAAMAEGLRKRLSPEFSHQESIE